MADNDHFVPAPATAANAPKLHTATAIRSTFVRTMNQPFA